MLHSARDAVNLFLLWALIFIRRTGHRDLLRVRVVFLILTRFVFEINAFVRME